MRRSLAALLAVMLTGCAPPNDRVSVELDEFTVTPEPSTVGSGPVAFDVSNGGTVSHSLAILETDLRAADLPLRDSEVVVDAEGIKLSAATPDVIVPGARYELSAEIEPGSFVLICTVPGHYQSGMFAPLEVTSRP